MTKYILACVLFLLSVPVHADTIAIGVLEQPQCKDSKSISARIMFLKQGNYWESFQDPQIRNKVSISQVVWTVAHNGNKLGEVRVIDPDPQEKFINSWYYGRDKLYQVPADQEIPLVVNSSKKFGGWCDLPEYLPIAIVTRANFEDPEQWTPFKPDDSYRVKLDVPLKIAIGRFNAFSCISGPDLHPTAPYDIKLDDIDFYECYAASSGKKLVSIGLNHNLVDCLDILPPEWGDNWFLLDGEDIDFIGREMTLVDVGDYDKDGKTEFLFWHSGYNEDGYVLIYDSFRKQVKYYWGYH